MPGFQLVEQPFFPPSRCACCGTGNSQHGFIDTMAEHPMPVGRFYICGDCVREAAGMYGFLDPDRKQQLIERLADAANTIDRLEGDLEQARSETVQVVSLADALKLTGVAAS